MSATTAQIASMYQAIGNDGVRVPLSLVAGCRWPDGSVTQKPDTTGTRVVSAGESFTFESSDIHRVTHVEGSPAVTIHVYSPPLHAMGAYEVTEEGRLRRTPLSAETSLSA